MHTYALTKKCLSYSAVMAALLGLSMTSGCMFFNVKTGAPLHKEGEEIEGYEIVWRDEFDTPGAIPSTNDWHYEKGNGNGGWGNNEKQYYLDNSSRLSKNVAECKAVDGESALVITAYYDNGWKSARMLTNKSWKYGIIEARMKVTNTYGAWPAFWMMPKNNIHGTNEKGDTWPLNGEIDIMENSPSTNGFNKVFSTLHASGHYAGNGANIGRKTFTSSDISKEWHTFTIKWEEDCITAYYDDDYMGEYQKGNSSYEDWPYDQEFYIILNLAIGGDLGDGQTNDSENLKGTDVEYCIDYVRVYQKK